MKLKKAQSYLSGIENINEGGCGIAALSIFRSLKKKAEIIEIEESFLFQKKSHIAIKLNNKVIDSFGSVDVNKYDRYQKIINLSEKELVNQINNKSIWAKLFNRNSISGIERNLGICLNDIK
jgi:hypothetical protein